MQRSQDLGCNQHGYQCRYHHRQLRLLEDQTAQTTVMLDRLLKEISDNVQRSTAYAATEHANLTVLAASIKSGELYGGGMGVSMGSAVSGVQMASGGTPLVVIKFDRPGVDYQQILYAALNQALQNRPSAGFQVVAVSPTRGTAASVKRLGFDKPCGGKTGTTNENAAVWFIGHTPQLATAVWIGDPAETTRLSSLWGDTVPGPITS